MLKKLNIQSKKRLLHLQCFYEKESRKDTNNKGYKLAVI